MGLIQDYLQVIRGTWPDGFRRPYTNIAKIEILDANENILDEITMDILSGSVNIVRQTGSRRTASITLKNKDLIYNLSPDGIWLDTKFRIWSGVEDYLENRIYFSQGIFILGECYEISEPSSATVRLELYDKNCLLDNTISGQLLNSLIIPLNTNIVDALDTILTDANTNQPLIAYTVKPLIADDSTVVLPYTLRVDEGGTYFDVIQKLADAISWVFYFDRDGFPHFEAPVDYDNEPATLTLSEEDPIKISFSKQTDIQAIRNSVRVVGGNFNTGEIFDATAQDTTITDPIRIGRIGERQYYIPDDIIYSTALAQLRADYELSNVIQASENINSQMMCLDFLDVGNIIELTDARMKLVLDRYLTNQITLPIVHLESDMTADIWRTRSFTE